jgi:hypothetical protein
VVSAIDTALGRLPRTGDAPQEPTTIALPRVVVSAPGSGHG